VQDSADTQVTISDQERRDWKRLREEKKLTTRELARLAKVSNTLVTFIENGTQTQTSRARYVAIVRVLRGLTEVQSGSITDEVIERREAAYKRLVNAIADVPIEQVEALAVGVEASKARPK
jgi:predicted transcriptional regulator